MNKSALDHMEGLINTAHMKGLYQRFPERFYKKPDICEAVKYDCDALDKLGVSWRKQNNALHIINDIDNQKTWEFMYRFQHRKIAENILNS